ncbi:PAS domain-containing sensor histidine kinase [Winogradskyella alexanderae]|uniref:histidine kinase n=1 Tax=Winogradskyella alexanderae TaxID=2877123 RepID=A0ABS7XNL2_9FLAO|nr:PAS domain S-box protein [Winogradskyella alexanderae]MCA0131600.1 PAS domain S-box protein [Winogradskyella alexanderae]
MSEKEVNILKRALERERASRKAAEKILEEKSAELFKVNKMLEQSYSELTSLYNKTSSQLQGVFENIVDAYVIMDLSGNILKMNDAAVEMFGFKSTQEEENLNNLVSPSDIDIVKPAFKKLITDGLITDFKINITTKHNVPKIVHINASIIEENGEPVAAQGIVRDITMEREAQEKLIESENRLSTLIKSLDTGVLLEDEHRKIVLTNNKFCEFFGIPVSPELLVGQDCSKSAEQSKDLFQDPDGFVSRINEILFNKKLVLGDELKMTNGKILERDYIPIYRSSEYQGHLWSYRDVTMQRQYSWGIEAEREKYGSIIANMHLGLVEVNNDDEILLVNQSFVEMSGYNKDELIGKKGGELLQADKSNDIITAENEKRAQGLSNSYELKVRTKSGEIRNWLISGAPNYDINGIVKGSIGIHLDITELKNLQIQKEKLLAKLEKSNEELQEYAHIVSHDLKSPLRSIDALVSWLKEDNKDNLDEASHKNLDLIQSTLEKMEQLISDVLNYSRVSTENKVDAEVDVQQLVEDVIELVYVPEHIHISILNKLPVVNGDSTKLQQVFQNLIGNAIKFNDKEKGLIEIDVLDEATHYKFSIKDNGIGIEPQFHDNIFKIFHALNKRKDSSGIGLSIVKKIIGLHGGNVWLESTPKMGTTFYFTLTK